jgi:hypothetical protein
MSAVKYNLQRNASGKLILMMSGNRAKYEGLLPEANTETVVYLDGEAWVLPLAKIAINKGWPKTAEKTGTNYLHVRLAEWFDVPVVDKERAHDHLRKGKKCLLRKTGQGYVLEPM